MFWFVFLVRLGSVCSGQVRFGLVRAEFVFLFLCRLDFVHWITTSYKRHVTDLQIERIHTHSLAFFFLCVCVCFGPGSNCYVMLKRVPTLGIIPVPEKKNEEFV